MSTPAKQTGRISQRATPSPSLLATQTPAATVGSSSGIGAPAPARTREPNAITMGQIRSGLNTTSVLPVGNGSALPQGVFRIDYELRGQSRTARRTAGVSRLVLDKS